MGKLIVIESGTDGSGKASQTEKLYSYLKELELNVIKVSYPNYGKPQCALVEMYLNGDFGNKAFDVNPYTSSIFYAADRYASYKLEWEDKFALEDTIVLADRYVTSNIIHQGAKFKTHSELDRYVEWIEDLEYNKNNIPSPDMVIYLDLPYEYSQKLIEKRGLESNHKIDIHEKDKAYLKKSYETSKYLAKKLGWKRIECIENGKIRPIDSIAKDINTLVLSYLME